MQPQLKSCPPHHIALLSQKLRLSVLFYKKILGLTPFKRQFDTHKKIRAVWFQLGPTVLMIEKTTLKNLKPSAVIALKIAPNQKPIWKQHLRKHKIKITNETDCTIYFSDPSGHHLALSFYKF